jgi:hypothetical protein
LDRLNRCAKAPWCWVDIAVVTFACASFAVPAFAQGAADELAAESLFEEGKFLLSAGKIALACAKFEMSQARAPSHVALVTLADCYERQGKMASAWATYRSAAAAAQNAKQPEREKIARDHAAAVERKLARLKIAVAADLVALAPEIRRDGVIVPRDSWGVAVLVDPGTISVTVSVAGKKSWNTSIDAMAAGISTVDVTLASIVGEQVAAAAPAPVISAPAVRSGGLEWNEQRVAALVVGGVGVAGLAAGTVFGLVRNSRLSEVKSNCADWPSDCAESARDPQQSAKSAGTIATVSFVVGSAAIAGAAVLWLTAPRETARGEKAAVGVQIVPVVGREGGSLAVRGVW